jgi:hypothetical protein
LGIILNEVMMIQGGGGGGGGCFSGHPELEVRIKALEQLRVMLDTNMVDLAYYYNSTPHVTDALLRNLLEWFNLPAVSHEGLVISSLIKLAEACQRILFNPQAHISNPKILSSFLFVCMQALHWC